MLEYENQMLTDLTEEDGLLIMARGLGLERVLCGLITCYNNPGSLVLVVGATPLEIDYITQRLSDTKNLDAGGAPNTVPPRCVTAELPVNDRTAVYMEGGVLFVTSRILVVDLLRDRVPAKLITGIIVWKAHKILESCQEAFILRLYRQKNKTGFIKGLSNNAVSFTHGFCQVSRVMKNLFVRRLFLYPRFHLSVTETLADRKPEVVELHLRMTPAMVEAQSSLVDLVAATVHELKLVTRGNIDPDMLTPEVALSPLFERLVGCVLQPMWDQLSTKTRHLVADLRLLRTLNNCLTQYDCVTFYNLTSSLRTTERALQSSGWMMLPPAEMLFQSARQRLFGEKFSAISDLKQKADRASKNEQNPLDLSLEVNPKWSCLDEVLAEVRSSARDTTGPLPERCLIVTQDDTTAHQLQQVLVDGPDRVLQKLFYQTVGTKLNLVPPAHLFIASNDDPKNKKPRKKKFTKRKSITKPNEEDEEAAKKMKLFVQVTENSAAITTSGAPSNGSQNTERVDVVELSEGGSKDYSNTPGIVSVVNREESTENQQLDETVTLTQIHEKYKFVGDSSDSDSASDEDCGSKRAKKSVKQLKKDELKKKYEEKLRRKNLFSSPLILIQSLKNYSDPFSLPRLLREVQPRYIVLYDSNLDFIRQVEVWQAESAPHQCLVYLMIYKGTTDEQLYLTQVKREKDAFHYLIKEKASLVFPEHAEGRSNDHPDLQRDPRRAADRIAEEVANTRKGGGQEQQQDKEESCVIVDMREFRSELPALIHKRGIEIEPVTIEVGDYILSPDMCVERKSLSDLVGSLNNGRLYSQAVSMTRHYSKPMLLIEFDQNKPFHLQANVLSNSRGVSGFGTLTQGEPDNRDVTAKLQLLTLHFPRLRLLWCSSPYATAEMFHLLKDGKPEPNIATAQAIKSDSSSMDAEEKYNPAIYDFMCKLPGITTKNVDRVMRGAADLTSLISMDQSGLTELLENSVHAAQLHAALHATLTPEDITKDTMKIKGKLTRKGLPKFGNNSNK